MISGLFACASISSPSGLLRASPSFFLHVSISPHCLAADGASCHSQQQVQGERVTAIPSGNAHSSVGSTNSSVGSTNSSGRAASLLHASVPSSLTMPRQHPHTLNQNPILCKQMSSSGPPEAGQQLLQDSSAAAGAEQGAAGFRWSVQPSGGEEWQVAEGSGISRSALFPIGRSNSQGDSSNSSSGQPPVSLSLRRSALAHHQQQVQQQHHPAGRYHPSAAGSQSPPPSSSSSSPSMYQSLLPPFAAPGSALSASRAPATTPPLVPPTPPVLVPLGWKRGMPALTPPPHSVMIHQHLQHHPSSTVPSHPSCSSTSPSTAWRMRPPQPPRVSTAAATAAPSLFAPAPHSTPRSHPTRDSSMGASPHVDQEQQPHLLHRPHSALGFSHGNHTGLLGWIWCTAPGACSAHCSPLSHGHAAVLCLFPPLPTQTLIYLGLPIRALHLRQRSCAFNNYVFFFFLPRMPSSCLLVCLPNMRPQMLLPLLPSPLARGPLHLLSHHFQAMLVLCLSLCTTLIPSLLCTLPFTLILTLIPP